MDHLNMHAVLMSEAARIRHLRGQLSENERERTKCRTARSCAAVSVSMRLGDGSDSAWKLRECVQSNMCVYLYFGVLVAKG
jgi:hypothetical protein